MTKASAFLCFAFPTAASALYLPDFLTGFSIALNIEGYSHKRRSTCESSERNFGRTILVAIYHRVAAWRRGPLDRRVNLVKVKVVERRGALEGKLVIS